MEDESYLFASARVVFGDRTWWWRTLLIGTLVALGVFSAGAGLAADLVRGGYGALMIRDLARGGERRWPRFSDVGGLVTNTLYWLVISSVWMVPLVIVATVLAVLFLGPRAGELLSSGSSTLSPLWFRYSILGGYALMEVLPNVAVMRAVASSRFSAGFSLPGAIRLMFDSTSGFLGATGVLFASAAAAVLLDAIPRLLAALFVGSVPLSPLPTAWRVATSFIMLPIELMVPAAYGLWARRSGLAEQDGRQDAVVEVPVARTRLQDILIPACAEAGSWSEQEDRKRRLSAMRVIQAGVVRDVREGKPSVVFADDDSAPFHLDDGEQLIWAFGGAKWIERHAADGGEPMRPPQAGYQESGKFTRLPAVSPDDQGAHEGVLGIGSRHLSFISADVWHRVPYSDIAAIGAYRDGVSLQMRQDGDAQVLILTGDGWAAYNLIANLAARCSSIAASDAAVDTAQREALDPAPGKALPEAGV